MKWLEITVTTAPGAVEAVAHILLEGRAAGVEELTGPSGAVRLRGYVPAGPAAGAAVEAVRARVLALPQFGLDVGPGTVETAEIDEEAWAEAWKTHFRPVAVGRLWITPSWERPAPPPGSVLIELDPGMAFGSGLHPSTQMCLRVLDERLRPGDVVFDVGTGSGILSIAAAKLGAAYVIATDVDAVAVDVARANVVHNGVASTVHIQECNLLDGVDGAADVVVANLTADIHLDFLPAAEPRVKAGGLLALSGIVADRLREVDAGARSAGFRTTQTLSEAEWRCLVLTPEV